MRLTTLLPLFAALLIATAHPSLVSGDDLCSPGMQRCNRSNALQVCSDNGIWATVTQCTATEICNINVKDSSKSECCPLSHATNSTASSITAVSFSRTVSARPTIPTAQSHSTVSSSHTFSALPTTPCKPNSQRCLDNKIYTCYPLQHWSLLKVCGEDETCVRTTNTKVACLPTIPKTAEVPKEPCQWPGALRCIMEPERIQECGPLAYWKDMATCNKGEMCKTLTLAGNDTTTGCMNPSFPFSNSPTPSPTKPPGSGFTPEPARHVGDPCPGVGEVTCDIPMYSLLVCNASKKWDIKSKCASPGDCKIDGRGKAHCERGGVAPPRRAVATESAHHVGDPCPSTGDLTCDTSMYSLLICNTSNHWSMKSKCASPGDCKTDSPSKAHCQRGGIAPPHALLARTQPQPECKDDQTACDSSGRFNFMCTTNGTWGDAFQCFGPGWCRHRESQHRKICDGWPTYDHYEGCADGCEFQYMYCGGNYKPDCWDQLCHDPKCATCDRCTYKKPAGGIQVDLSSVECGWNRTQG